MFPQDVAASYLTLASTSARCYSAKWLKGGIRDHLNVIFSLLDINRIARELRQCTFLIMIIMIIFYKICNVNPTNINLLVMTMEKKGFRGKQLKKCMLFKNVNSCVSTLVSGVYEGNWHAYNNDSSSDKYARWPKVCGHPTITPICGTALNCCHTVRRTQ